MVGAQKLKVLLSPRAVEPLLFECHRVAQTAQLLCRSPTGLVGDDVIEWAPWHEYVDEVALHRLGCARKRVEDGWVPMSKSLLTRVQLVRFEIHEIQARTALAVRDLKTAEHYTDKLGRVKQYIARMHEMIELSLYQGACGRHRFPEEDSGREA